MGVLVQFKVLDLFVVLFQCTVTPTHCVVLHDAANMKTDHVQQLMYSVCQLYCNWCTVCVSCTATDVRSVSAVLQLMYSLCQLYCN